MQTKSPRNDKGNAHGYWEVYRDNNAGTLWYKTNFINDEMYGYYQFNFSSHPYIEKKYYAR